MIGQLTNHLFQSTIFALAAALLVLAFRKNRARIRYALWLAASLKFLIPFSVLIALGSQIHWTPATHEIATRAASPEVVQTVEQFSEPFTAAIPTQPKQTNRMPFAIAAIWFCGFACIIVLRLRAWRGMRIAIRRSQPLDLGLPVEARLSSGIFEPGIVGLWRPMLLLPQGILERLTPSELEAVIAHELCHIRRRDNLFAAIHMAVEALFWFHPLVWWIGARLLDERELACDEYVVSQGNRPDIYADAILNVCKLYAESPLACVSGVTGADIRRRLETIMSNQKVAGLNLAKKAVLACAAIAAIAAPLSVGLLIAQPAPKFDVVSIKPCGPDAPRIPGGGVGSGTLKLSCAPLVTLVRIAYVTFGNPMEAPVFAPDPLSGGPAWAKSDTYAIEAKTEGNPSGQMMKGSMLRTLLEDRFRLKIHRETREVPVYTLRPAKTGLRMTRSKDGSCIPTSVIPDGTAVPEKPLCTIMFSANASGRNLTAYGITLDEFARYLGDFLDRPVVNQSGIAGKFDIRLQYMPSDTGGGGQMQVGGNPDVGPAGQSSVTVEGPSISTALREQLGLTLESSKGNGEFIVIDSVERPSEN